MPASGKTSIAKQLEKYGFQNLSRDHFISSLFNPVHYSSRKQKDIAYKAMMLVAEYHLRSNRKVVLDCPSFSQRWAIKLAQETARKTRSKFKLIFLTCPDHTAVHRIRSSKNHTATDRTPALYFNVKKRFQPLTVRHAVIRTDRAIKDTMIDIIQYLKK